MFVVIGLMLTGVLIGWVTRKHCLKFLQQIIPVFIWYCFSCLEWK